MLAGSFLFPSPFSLSRLLWLQYGCSQGCEPPHKFCKSGMCQQDPTVVKREALMAKGKDQVVQIKRKLHLITSPPFFTSVLMHPPVHFSFTVPILSYSSLSNPCCPYLKPLFLYTSILVTPYPRHGNHHMRFRNEKVKVPSYCSSCWFTVGMELELNFS